MPSPPDDPAPLNPPMLRGLDPAGLASVLGAPLERPSVLGWRIGEVAGEGGLGVVWRAVRESDGVVAAVKIAAGDDQDTVERIEAETAALRALDHANIVPLLDSGPLADGGLFLAMKFIAGTSLAQAIPPGGLPPARAYALFHAIAAGVAHAHGRGILHCDLKPANILMAPPLAPGGETVPMVADFGLAKPVHARVEHLSMTQAGLIAGTVEYLPPEAYVQGYQPKIAGDVYALGVILYEMLACTPPRGAWSPVAEIRRVDVRVDEVLRHAMHPEPARRWESVAAMSAALAAIEASAPRFAGSPLVTMATRAADAFWTVLGLAVLFVTVCTLIRLDKGTIPVPIDFIGQHSVKTGGFQALFYLMQALVPLCGWQLARLWRFRRVPLREALPSLFGLKLGGSRTAAVLVGLTQIFCFLLPVYFLHELYADGGTKWVRSGDGPWTDGLCVTVWGKGFEGDGQIPLSPWDRPKAGANYWLKHMQGPPDQHSSFFYDRISFLPFYVPAEMVSVAAITGVTLLATIAAGVRGWVMRRRWVWAGVVLALALSGSAFSWQEWSKKLEEETSGGRMDRHDDHTRRAVPHSASALTEHLFSEQAEGLRPLTPELLDDYADLVDYRDQGPIPCERIAELHAADCAKARAERRTMWNAEPSAEQGPHIPGNNERWLKIKLGWVQLTDPPPTDGAHPEAGPLAVAALHRVIQEGNYALRNREQVFRFQRERMEVENIYEAVNQPLTLAAAEQWRREFFAALAMPHPRTLERGDPVPEKEPLARVFHTRMLHGMNRNVNDTKMYPASARPRWIIHELRSYPGLKPLEGVVPRIEPLAGARGRIRFIMVEPKSGRSIYCNADLARIEGAWRCVQFFYNPNTEL